MKQVEFKKHKKQMTPTDKNLVRKKLQAIDSLKMYNKLYRVKHLRKRKKDKEINFLYKDVKRWIEEAQIIEYKIRQTISEHRGATERVIIRGHYDEVDDIILVIDITKELIITAWKNEKTDTHKTLNLSNYCNLVKIK